jgi:hypothetical protein
MRLGYGRVSTRDQHPEAKHEALKAAGYEQIYIETAPGKLARRAELDKALLSANRVGDQPVELGGPVARSSIARIRRAANS